MADSPLEISYRTSVDEPRTGPVGAVLRRLGDHPVWSGLICGVAVVIIAAIRSPAGVRAAPVTAGLISLAVVAVWMILFFLMRRFFRNQSFATRSVRRRLVVDDESARWLQDDEVLERLDAPRLRIATNPVPEEMTDDEPEDREATAWPVWIVIEGDETETRLIFETRDSARRAQNYREVDGAVIDETDERLPRAIAAPILHHVVEDESEDAEA